MYYYNINNEMDGRSTSPFVERILCNYNLVNCHFNELE